MIDLHASFVIVDHRAYGHTGCRTTQHAQQLFSILAYTDTQGVAQLSTRSFDANSKSALLEGWTGVRKVHTVRALTGVRKVHLLRASTGI